MSDASLLLALPDLFVFPSLVMLVGREEGCEGVLR